MPADAISTDVSPAFAAVSRNTTSAVGERQMLPRQTNSTANRGSCAMEFVRSHISNITGTAVDLNATNGSKVYFDARDSTASHSAKLIKTSGTSRVAVSLIRSDFRHTPIILDHGNGEVRIDGSHFVQCTQDFVDNGSGGGMLSLDNNFVLCDDLPGPTYITPNKILPK